MARLMWGHHLKLNAIVLIWSFTAILGQWITLPRFELVFLRTFAAAGVLFAYWRLFRPKPTPSPDRGVWPHHSGKLFLNGALVGLHWVLFFSSAQLNASVCLAAYATTTLWTAILEPLLNRTPWKRSEIFLGAIITVALCWIAQAEAAHSRALILGLGAAVSAALFAVLNGKWARGEDAVAVTILEMLGASAVCLCGLALRFSLGGQSPQLALSLSDALWMSLLILFCTAYAYVAYIELLRHLSVFTISLAANFEPVYGMLLAAVLLGEASELSISFYGGSALIFICLLAHTWMTSRQPDSPGHGGA